MPNQQKTLVLVDLDNVSFSIKKDDQFTYTINEQPCIVGATEPEASFGTYQGQNLGAIVCLAFNQEKVRGKQFSFSFLCRLAHHIARRFKVVGDVVCEVAVCFTVPESADIALQRLFFHAPHFAHSGEFSRIFLFSNDRDLLRSFNHLASPYTKKLHKKDSKSWMGWEKKEPFHTRQPPQVTSQESPLAPPEGWSIPILTESQAAWATKQPVEIEIPQTSTESVWSLLCKAIDKTPHLFSQISVTKQSTRGVLRCTPSLLNTPLLGECSHQDGLFVQHLSQPNNPQDLVLQQGDPIQNANTALGSIYLPKQKITLRTNLPPAALSAVIQQNPYLIPLYPEKQQIKDGEVLQNLQPNSYLGKLCQIKMYSHSNRSIFQWKITLSPEEYPRSWWYISLQASTYQTLSLPSNTELPKSTLAQMRKHENNIVMAIPQSLQSAEPTNQIPPWTLGTATIPNGKIALLALDAPLTKDQTYEIVPIQDYPRPKGWGALANHWQALQKFPIALAKCQISRLQRVSTKER